MPLKRHPALVPLSRDHHRALLLARGLQRGASRHLRAALPAESAALAAHVCAFHDVELVPHFRAEDRLMRAAGGCSAELARLCEQIEAEHGRMHEMVDALRRPMDAGPQSELLDRFGTLLEAHVRTEERSLYEAIQASLSDEVLARLDLTRT